MVQTPLQEIGEKRRDLDKLQKALEGWKDLLEGKEKEVNHATVELDKRRTLFEGYRDMPSWEANERDIVTLKKAKIEEEHWRLEQKVIKKRMEIREKDRIKQK